MILGTYFPAMIEMLSLTGDRIAVPRRDVLAYLGMAGLEVLSRYPTPAERKTIDKYISAMPKRKQGKARLDLLWALFNSKEFIYHH